MATHARSAFDVKLVPRRMPTPNRPRPMTIDKQFHSGLEDQQGTDADRHGRRERLRRLCGNRRSRRHAEWPPQDLILQRIGTVARGAQRLTMSVVPDSGTGELVGLTGTIAIIITSGAHAYGFTYALPAS